MKKGFRASSLLCWILMASLVPPATAVPLETDQDTLPALKRFKQLEMPDDGYVPDTREHMPRSPAYRFSTRSFFTVQVNVDDSSQNIVGDAANEPSIAVDPTDPGRMAIGWRQFNTVSSNFRQAGFAYTTDRGRSWTFPGVIEPGVFRSDPVLGSDSNGDFYFNSLTSISGQFHCDVFKSSTGGATWGAGTFAQGGDKQWMTIDKTGGMGDGNIYAFWTSAYSACPPGSFTRSANRGASYESCIVIPDDPFWGTLAVGPDAELYVCGAGFTGFVVAKSFGAQDSSQTVSWDTVSAVNLDGEISAFAGSTSPNPGGLLGQAWVAVDRSSGPSRGNVYVLCSVDRTSVPDPLDVMFARSTDGGASWSAPVRVNDDAGTAAWQWFGTLSVAPNGRIDVIWLDTRDNPGSVNSSLYYAYSMDAGLTWSPNERLSASFNPHVGWPQQNKMGDYFDMISDDAGAHIAWAATFNNEQDVYYGRISVPAGVAEPEAGIPGEISLLQNYPNPFNSITRIIFRVVKPEPVELRVFDVLGRDVATLVNEVRQPGTYEVRFPSITGAGARDLTSGVYLCRLSTSGVVHSKKLLLVR